MTRAVDEALGGGLTGLNRDPTYCLCVWNQSLVEASAQRRVNIWLQRRRAMNSTKIVSTRQEHISSYIHSCACVGLVSYVFGSAPNFTRFSSAASSRVVPCPDLGLPWQPGFSWQFELLGWWSRGARPFPVLRKRPEKGSGSYLVWLARPSRLRPGRLEGKGRSSHRHTFFQFLRASMV